MLRLNNNKKSKILIADSCAGGIAILKYFIDDMSNSEFTFLVDGQKNPFGIKTKEAINEIVEDWLKYAKNHDFDMLVIACNTASIAVYKNVKSLENKYKITIVTMIDALCLSCNNDLSKIKNKNIVLFGTIFTVESDIYMSILSKFKPKIIFKIPGMESEKLVARGLFQNINQVNKSIHEIEQFSNQNVDTFILACTCFEFLKETIKSKYKNVLFVNPSEMMSKIIVYNWAHANDYNLENINLITTGNINEWALNINIIAKKVFNKDIKVKQVKIR